MKNSFTSTCRYVKSSPQKIRLVVKSIKKKKVSSALKILLYMRKKAAFLVYKVLWSAVSNAKNKKKFSNIDDFIISSISVDQGKNIKRMLPRAKGRADSITKRTSHITVIIDKVN